MQKEHKMRKIIVSEAVALDGVFDAQTMGKWAVPYYSEEREEYIRGIVLASDTLLLGRTTYDIQAWFWPNQKADKYGMANHKNSMVKVVVTSTPLQAQWNNTKIIEKNAVEEVAKLKQQPGKNILIEGSAMLVQALLQAELIDEINLVVHPAVAGSGKRLFNDGAANTKLMKLVENKTLRQGVVALTYELAK
jgi:dihydrofolate reductase